MDEAPLSFRDGAPAPDPESRDSGLDASHRPGMTSSLMTASMKTVHQEHTMRFDLVDLQLFVAVAETRSITNGAQRVHLALASASARIKRLEAALGVSLLRRGRRGVELTAAGETLLDHARVVLHNVEAVSYTHLRAHETDSY